MCTPRRGLARPRPDATCKRQRSLRLRSRLTACEEARNASPTKGLRGRHGAWAWVADVGRGGGSAVAVVKWSRCGLQPRWRIRGAGHARARGREGAGGERAVPRLHRRSGHLVNHLAEFLSLQGSRTKPTGFTRVGAIVETPLALPTISPRAVKLCKNPRFSVFLMVMVRPYCKRTSSSTARRCSAGASWAAALV